MNKTLKTTVELLEAISDDDLEALCEATNQAVLDGNGFGWLKPPPRDILESYWKGVLLVPERDLYAARLDGQVVGSAQLVKPPRNNEAGAHIAVLSTFFIAPWARGMGLARGLLRAVEKAAKKGGFEQLDLDVRASQEAAIALYEESGFRRWATKDNYARVNGHYVAGYYYSKQLTKSGKAGKSPKTSKTEDRRGGRAADAEPRA